MPARLNDSQLRKLREHKYSASGTSILEPAFQKLWNKLIEYVPASIAPNALTITGLLLNISSTIILVLYSPDGKSEIPALPFLFAAFSLFSYQTLDALDGKQARKTKTSSPLGELFDHGCDSFSTVFVSIGSALAVGMGEYPTLLFVEVLTSVSLFYMAQWQCYVSGTLEFGTLDVTEAQVAVIGVYITSAIFGVQFWSKQMLPMFPALSLKMLHVVLLIGPSITMCIRFLDRIMRNGRGKNGTTVANTSVVSPIIPIGAVVLMAINSAKLSQTNLYENNPCLFLITFGMVASKLTNKIVVAHMTKSEIQFFDSSYVGPLLILFNQRWSLFNELTVLWLAFIYSTYDVLKYSVEVCREIADFLVIYVFSVQPRAEVASSTTTPPLSHQHRAAVSDAWSRATPYRTEARKVVAGKS